MPKPVADLIPLLEEPIVRDLLEAVEELLDDWEPEEPESGYTLIADELLYELEQALLPFRAARDPGGLWPEDRP